MEEKIYAVSACLMGINCKYNGGNNLNPAVTEFLKDKKYITICPETTGGLSCPRAASEIIKDSYPVKVITEEGTDVTENFERGAAEESERMKKAGCNHAILKSKSPSCGVGMVYDGTFTGKLTYGNGITAELFLKNGIKCITEKDEIFTEGE